ncbi:MAG: DUF559 domain-containing protein [Anaerolineaceae bacterium]|nr:DUF559 domain-containing protein [Anaerolineaceae bacterium]
MRRINEQAQLQTTFRTNLYHHRIVGCPKTASKANAARANPCRECLWALIRNRNLAGFKFRRQHPIDRFIVDFFCAEAYLVIEVDGSIHDYTHDEDALRTAFLESRGLRVLRFCNDDVLEHLAEVREQIERALNSPQILTSIAWQRGNSNRAFLCGFKPSYNLTLRSYVLY